MGIFIWCMIIGSGLIILSLLLDGIFDLDGDGWVFSGAVAIASFGAFGNIFEHLKMNLLVTVILAGVFAAFLTSLVAFLIRRLKSSTDSEMNDFPDLEDAIGERATVVWWNENSGEVDVLLGGHYKRLEAKFRSPSLPTDSKIEVGDFLKIVNIDNELLEVERI